MDRLPCDIRARMTELGELSRPLGEAPAKDLARRLAVSVLLDLLAERNVHGTLDAYKERIKGEIERRTLVSCRQEQMRSRTSWSDMLPEIPAAL
jgi:hypothetical protein